MNNDFKKKVPEDFLKGKLILVVDDEPDLRDILCEEIQFFGGTTESAQGGDEAFVRFKTTHFHMVISDMRMPQGTGIDLLKAIRKQDQQKTPVLLLTGFTDVVNEDAYNEGAEAVLSKPIEMDLLMFSVYQLFISQRERLCYEAELNLKNRSSLEVISFPDQSFDDLLRGDFIKFGRGGVFVSGHFEKIVPGQLVQIDLPDLTGTAVCRWKRDSFDNELKSGLGLEFSTLSLSSLDIIESRVFSKEKPVAWIPKA